MSSRSGPFLRVEMEQSRAVKLVVGGAGNLFQPDLFFPRSITNVLGTHPSIRRQILQLSTGRARNVTYFAAPSVCGSGRYRFFSC